MESFRNELRRMLSSAEWTERSLAEGFDAKQGKIQGWLREKAPTRPPMDELQRLAKLKGLSTSELVAELLGEDAPSQGSIEEIAEWITPERLKEIMLICDEAKTIALNKASPDGLVARLRKGDDAKKL